MRGGGQQKLLISPEFLSVGLRFATREGFLPSSTLFGRTRTRRRAESLGTSRNEAESGLVLLCVCSFRVARLAVFVLSGNLRVGGGGKGKSIRSGARFHLNEFGKFIDDGGGSSFVSLIACSSRGELFNTQLARVDYLLTQWQKCDSTHQKLSISILPSQSKCKLLGCH
jgi:hypothetical protein